MKDPVCGMEIGSGGDVLVHKGTEYRFCCATCRWAFEQNPDQYTKQDD
ncbi:MAG: YHS domain-containing protein [Cenarchaeum sp. SB0663_bin_5]|nr:YHS domain-containing protein [Cenarchaeum sp. SB0663_bin_5]MYH04586.1 YHS domain-containing protein [Cenarchaeum sp. SB0675_bin_21]MYL11236.1 YHS domain-containing protein [Cenarchaeum sp. SB0669_bin_11]